MPDFSVSSSLDKPAIEYYSVWAPNPQNKNDTPVRQPDFFIEKVGCLYANLEAHIGGGYINLNSYRGTHGEISAPQYIIRKPSIFLLLPFPPLPPSKYQVPCSSSSRPTQINASLPFSSPLSLPFPSLQ